MSTTVYRAGQPASAAPDATAQAGPSRAVSTAAIVLGNVMEWYDFAIYAYMAPILARTFFPTGDELTSTLTTFAVFGGGMVMRPLGGILTGYYADRYGRKPALIVTMMLMAISTVGIGLTPSYATLGLAAPILVTLCRMLQGFSSGGEVSGSMAFLVESAPPARRGFYGSFQTSTVAVGLLLGSGFSALLTTILPAASLDSWGWRLAFIAGGVLGPIGMFMRRNLAESPMFEAEQAHPLPPVQEDGQRAGLQVLRAFGVTVVWTVAYYTCVIYMPSFLQKFAHFGRADVLWISTFALVIMIPLILLSGYLSDKVGRRPLMLACCGGLILFSWPLFSVLLNGVSFLGAVAVSVTLTTLIAMFSGPGPAVMAELFTTVRRSTLIAASYGTATAFLGGFAPFIATWLIDRTGSPLAPVWYLMAAAIVSASVILGMRETKGLELR